MLQNIPISRRIISWLLAFVMTVSVIPHSVVLGEDMSVYNSSGTYNEALVAELAAMYGGDQDKALTVLDTLQENGMIDQNGSIIFEDTFDVNGETVTKEQLRKLSEENDPSAPVTIDGQDMTWGDIRMLFAMLDAMNIIREAEKSTDTLTQEHIMALESFYENLEKGKFSLMQGEDGNWMAAFSEASTVEFRVQWAKKDGKYIGDNWFTFGVMDLGWDEKQLLAKYGLKEDSIIQLTEACFVQGYMPSSINSSIYTVRFSVYDEAFEYAISPNLVVRPYAEADNTTRYHIYKSGSYFPYDLKVNISILDGAYSHAKITPSEWVEVDASGKNAVATIPSRSTNDTNASVSVYVSDNRPAANSIDWFGELGYNVRITPEHGVIANYSGLVPKKSVTFEAKVAGRSGDDIGRIRSYFGTIDNPDTSLYPNYLKLTKSNAREESAVTSPVIWSNLIVIPFSKISGLTSSSVGEGQRFNVFVKMYTDAITGSAPVTTGNYRMPGTFGSVDTTNNSLFSSQFIAAGIGPARCDTLPLAEFTTPYITLPVQHKNSKKTDNDTGGGYGSYVGKGDGRAGVADSQVANWKASSMFKNTNPAIATTSSHTAGKSNNSLFQTNYMTETNTFLLPGGDFSKSELTSPDFYSNYPSLWLYSAILKSGVNNNAYGYNVYAADGLCTDFRNVKITDIANNYIQLEPTDLAKAIKPTVTIPKGTYYSGDIIPITVDLGAVVRLKESEIPNIKINVQNGDILTSSDKAVAEGGLTTKYLTTQKLTFNYTVKENDLVGFKVNSVYLDGTVQNPIGQDMTYAPVDEFQGRSFNDVKLSTPYKEDTFDFANGTITQENGTYKVRIPIAEHDTEEKKMDYMSWLAAEAFKYMDNGTFRLGSMYGSVDGGVTKIPFTVETADEEFTYISPATGQEVTVNEMPVAITMEYTPDIYMGEYPLLNIMSFFMDPALNCEIDYITDDQATAPFFLISDMMFYFLCSSPVYFEEGDIEITYDETWLAGADENKNTSAYDYVVAADMMLSYDFTKSASFTYTDPANFSWSSSNSDIVGIENAILDGKTVGVLIPGDSLADLEVDEQSDPVTFTLTAQNGANAPVEVISATLTVIKGDAPYFAVSHLSRETTIMASETAKIYFSTDIHTRNADFLENPNATTDITFNVYQLTDDGKRGENVYGPITETVSPSNIISNFQVPSGIMDKASKSGEFSYEAVVSATHAETGVVLSASGKIHVKPAPVKVSITDVSYDGAPVINPSFTLDDKPTTISFQINNFTGVEGVKKWYYTVTQKSDNTLVHASDPKSDIDVTSHTISVQVPDNKLKEVYNVTVYASNNPELDGYAVDSLLLNVYNADALDIMVYDALSSSATFDAGANSLVLDNNPRMTSLLSGGDGGKLELTVPVEEFRQDIHLSALVSIYFGEYVWGLISDQLEWEIDAGSDAALYAYKGGGWGDIRANLLTTYMPTAEFTVATTEEGSFTIKATHGATGMESTVTATANDLADKLFLFQAIPAIKTEVTYKNGGGTWRTLETDDTGAIAIYEPAGINSNVYLSSIQDEIEYQGMRYLEEIATGERNPIYFQVYPVNNVELVESGKVTIYLTGAPAGTVVNVRGAAYDKYSGQSAGADEHEYVTIADLLQSRGDVDEIYTDHSNGLHDQQFITDGYGRITVYFNMDQFKNTTDEVFFRPEFHDVYYAFELQFPDGEGGYLFKPEVFEAHPGPKDGPTSATKKIKLQQHSGPKLPFDRNRDIRVNFDQGGGRAYSMDLTGNINTERVGASEKYKELVLNSMTYLWDVPVSVYDGDHQKKHQALLDDSMPVYSAKYRLKDSKALCPGQDEITTIYEFSTFPILRNTFHMNQTTYGKSMNPDGSESSAPWINVDEEKSVEIAFTKDGAVSRIWPVPFRIINTIGKQEAAHSPEISESASNSVTKQLDKLDVDSMLSDLVPGGDMLAKGLSFFSGIASGGDYTVRIILVPTADPTIFNIILSVGDDTGAGETYMDYADATNTDDIDGLMDDLAEGFADDDEDDDEENGGDDNGVEFSFSGYMISRATYLGGDQWDIKITGGNIKAKVGIKKEYNQNFMIGPVPVTISLGAKASIGAGLGAQTQLIGGSEEFSTLIEIMIGAGVEAFVGVGFDFSVIALKIGIFGELGVEVTQSFLVKTASPKFMQGTRLKLNGEVGLKFVAKILCIKYEKTFASVGFETTKAWNDYYSIVNYWEGGTVDGQKYTATTFASGDMLFTLESSAIEDRDYLNAYTRVWIVDATSSAMNNEGWFSALQTNAYPYANPIFSDDGQIIVYLSDMDSTEAEQTTVCWAKWEGDGYVDQGPIAETLIDSGNYGFGDSDLTFSGSNGNYFASWVQITEKSNLSSGDEVSMEDLSLMMRSTEIMAAVYEDGAWSVQPITDNGQADLATFMASAGDNAMVFWRSPYATDMENPLDFNAEDALYYSRYDGDSWSEASIVYNGASGAIKGVGGAMASNGAGLVSYIVQTGEATDEEGQTANHLTNETFYSYIAADDQIESVRITRDNCLDENVQVVSVDDMFLVGWYQVRESKETDLRMLAVNSDGTIDTAFPESIAAIGNVTPTNNFRFAVSKDGTLDGLAIAWSERIEGVDTLQGVKLYEYDGKLMITGSQQIAEADANSAIDYFDAYTDGDGIHAVANITHYDDYSQVGRINITDIVDNIVIRDSYQTDEEYDAAWKAEYQTQWQQRESDVIAIYAQSGESKITQASYTFKNYIEIADTHYDPSSVIPNASLAVTYTVENKGIAPITEIKILDSTDQAIKTEAVTLLPGFSQKVTAVYRLGQTIADIPFKVVANGAQEATGVIEINRPDIAISSMELISEGNGQRVIGVNLNNSSNIPICGNDKTIKVGLYADSKHTILVGSPQEIDPSDNTAMTLIDNDAYMTSFTVDAVSLVSQHFNGEVPESGITLYAKAEFLDHNERKTSNNSKSITFQSMEKKAGEEISFQNIALEQDENNYAFTADVFNNTLVQKPAQSFIVTLLSADGEEIGSNDYWPVRGTHIPAESSIATSITIPADGEAVSFRIDQGSLPISVGTQSADLIYGVSGTTEFSIVTKGLSDPSELEPYLEWRSGEQEPYEWSKTAPTGVTYEFGSISSEDSAFVQTLTITTPDDINAGSYIFKVATGEDLMKMESAGASLVIKKAEYSGVKLTKVNVAPDEVTANTTKLLPALPEGAKYAVTGTVTDESGLITDHSIDGTTLSVSTSAQAAETTATIVIDVTDAINYDDYQVVVTVKAVNEPIAIVDDVTITGERLTDITDTDITITMENAVFKGLLVGEDVTDWFTNVPSGLLVKVKELKTTVEVNDTIVVTVSGNPTTKSSAVMTINIPVAKLECEAQLDYLDVTIQENINAKFAIIGTILSLDQTPQEFSYDGQEKSFAIIEANNYDVDFNVSYADEDGNTVIPKDAGVYDVEITRDQCDDYSAYNQSITGGIVINKIEPAAINVSADPTDSSVYGADVILNATIGGPTVPTGDVEFIIDDQIYDTKQLDSEGKATITWANPTAGEHTYKIKYLGDDNFEAKESAQNTYDIDNDNFVRDEDFETEGKTVTYDGNQHTISESSPISVGNFQSKV